MTARFVTLPLLFVMSLLPAAATAQQPETTDETTTTEVAGGAEVEQDQAGQRVFRDRIVVTASRQEEASAEVLAPITVIDRIAIEQAQPEKLADLFKDIPGVEVFGEGPFRGLPVIRGLSSNRVLVLVDGQRLNNGRESTTFAGIQPSLVNLSEVDRIEVLRGPASVQYGSDAIGGVINIITRAPDLGAPEFEVHADAAYEYGSSADSQGARAYVSGSGKGFGFTIGAAYQEADDYTAADGAFEHPSFGQYVDSDNTVYNSGMKQTSFDGSLRFLTGSQGVLRINAEAVRTEDIGFPGFDPSSGIDISFPNFDRDKLGVGWSSGPAWGLDDISLSSYYQTVDKESIRNIVVPGFSSENFTISEISSLGFNAQGVAKTGRHKLVFGVDLYRDEVDDQALVQMCFGPFCMPPSTEVSVPKSHQTGIGVYAQDRIELDDRLTLHAGLRGDTFDFKSEDDPDYVGEPFDVTDSAISGNLGVTYAVTDHVNLTGVIARGFRSPNLQERSFQGISTLPNTFIVQNPDLDSESSLNYEVGFKARYDRYFGGLSVYYNDISDFITFEFIGQDPASGQDLARFANVDAAKIWGVEFELETLFAEWWSLSTTIAYSEGDNDTTGEPLSFIAPLKAAVGLRYQQPRWWAEASARIVDRLDRVPAGEDESPGFTVYDLRAGYDFACGFGLVASLGNLSNKLYAEPFNNRPEPGRNLRVSARYRF